MRMRHANLWLALILILPAAGCKEESEAKAQDSRAITLPELTPSEAGDAAPDAAAAQAATQSGSGVSGPKPGATDEHGRDLGLVVLNEANKSFLENNERMPRNFQELLDAGLISVMPNPPSGKYYDLDPAAKKIVLRDK
jgi:hypothetical protein